LWFNSTLALALEELDMGTRIFKGLLALGFTVALVSGCASKPEEVAVVEEEPEVVSQPIKTVAPPPKPVFMIRDGSLFELGRNNRYVKVPGKFYFDFDQAMVKRQGHGALNKHAKYLGSDSGARVRTEGHADERGTREYNLALGERRANAVRAYLTSQGASNYQAEVVSYGEERAEVEGHKESVWSKNRRVELIYR
jgi:peptidoglycan-associated lipoprotein